MLLNTKLWQRKCAKMWNFEINSNGNTAEDLKVRFVDVVSACHKLEGVLSQLHEVVNGRNYQTLQNGNELREKDLQTYQDMLKEIRKVHDLAMNGAIKAHKSL